MEKQVEFRDDQELQAQDFTGIETGADEALSHVVADAVLPGLAYSGGLVTATSATEASAAAPLRLYNAGKVYACEQDQALNLFSYLPLVAKRLVAVVLWGQEIDTDVEPRDFLIDATTGATEPRAVAMTLARVCQVNLLGGAESADPQPPVIQTGNLALAYIYLTPTGIERIEMQTANELPQVADHEVRVSGLETWKGQAEPRISSIATDLAALARKADSLAARRTVIDIAADVARLKEQQRLPATFAAYDADYFGDNSKSDEAAAGYAARTTDGLLFPFAGSALAPVALFNPYDAAIHRHDDDLVLPAYTSVARIRTSGYAGDVALSQYQVQNQTIRKYTRTVTEYYYGPNRSFYAPWYQRWFWQYRGQNKDVDLPAPGGRGYVVVRSEDAYELVVATTSISGAILAQTLLVSNAMWLTKVGLFFTQIGAAGDVHVVICKTDGGKPVLEQALADVLVPQASLLAYPAETAIDIPPVLLEGGTRYAICIVTQGDHRVAVVAGENYTQGTLFFGTDGDYFSGDLTKDLMFTLYGAQFALARTEVQLQPISLAGGITDLAIALPQVAPKGTDLHFECQVGGKWYQIGDPSLVLSVAPDVIPLRAVLLGTSDLAPGLQLAANAITGSRPALAMTHQSALRTLGAASTQITVEIVAAGYDAVHHTLACSLIDGANTYTPSVTETALEPDGGATRFTFTFAIAGGVTTYEIKLAAGTDSAALPFAITERVDIAA